MNYKNLFLLFIIGIFLISMVSSLQIEEHLDKLYEKGSINPFGNKKLVYEPITKDKINPDNFMLSETSAGYPVIRLSKSSFWITSDKIAEYSLTKVEDSVINAYAEGKAVLYSKGRLFDDVNFKDVEGNLKELRDVQYYIWVNESYQIEVPEYKEECSETKSINGTLNCKNIKIGSHNETRYKEYWKPYNYETLDAGNYKWKLEAKKNHPNQAIDFVPMAQGITLDEMAWWNSSWDSKREIKIKENSGSNLTNYSTLIYVTYDNDMQSDFDDLRFVDSAETTELGYWIKNKTDSSFAYVWVKIPSLTASINSTIYMYYGNSLASSNSNGNNAFLLFDDFDDASLNTSKWDTYIDGATATLTESGGYVRGFTNSAWHKAYLSSDLTFNRPIILETNAYMGTATHGGYKGFGIIEKDISKYSHNSKGLLFITGDTNENLYNYDTSGSASSYDIPNNQIRNFKIHWVSSGNVLYFIDETQVGAISTQNPSVALPIGFKVDRDGSQEIRFYDVKVRNYVSSEPTYYILDEQSNFKVTLNSPINNYNSSSSLITFNCSGTDETGLTYLNLSVDGNYIYNLTGTGTTDLTLVHSASLSEGTHNWTCTASNGINTTSASARNLLIDSISPQITLNYPTSLIDYGIINTTLQLNITANDTHLDKVWYDYNGTNITLTGAISGIYNVSNITLSEKKNITIYANDTIGHLTTNTFNWDYKIFENGRWLNSSTYETATENYIISLSSNSSLTNVYLNYSNNSIPTTSSSGNWTYSRDAPIGTIGNQTINWIATYSGENISIPIYSYQNVLETVFTICNATYTNDALNLTFKDEANLNYINATIPTSTWTYYLGSGAVNKTYTYSSTTEQMNYVFCSSVDRNLNVNPYVQFKKGTDYPQRIWEPSTKQYNQSVIEQTLYLLSSTDGIYVTYQVLDGTGTQIGGVDVVAKRTINGEEFIVGIGQTDAAGAITFWMNPDFVHSITFSKEGYTTYTLNQFPTQTIYTITIGQTSGGDVTDYLRGITYQIKPPFGQTLNASQLYNFNMTFNSSYWELDSFGFEIYGDNVLIGANSSTNPTGGYLQNILNISNYEHISMEIYWIINGTLTYGRNDGWFVFNYDEGTEWSVWTFFKDLSTYTDADGGNGIFGLTQNGLNLIIFIIIFLVTGLVSYKFSVTSPAVVSGIIFAMVFLFDVGLGMIKVNVFGGVQYFPTIFMLIIMVALIIKEATQ